MCNPDIKLYPTKFLIGTMTDIFSLCRFYPYEEFPQKKGRKND